jgi:hypothetical protein
MNRRAFLSLGAAGLPGLRADTPRPNVLIAISDDQSWLRRARGRPLHAFLLRIAILHAIPRGAADGTAHLAA